MIRLKCIVTKKIHIIGSLTNTKVKCTSPLPLLIRSNKMKHSSTQLKHWFRTTRSNEEEQSFKRKNLRFLKRQFSAIILEMREKKQKTCFKCWKWKRKRKIIFCIIVNILQHKNTIFHHLCTRLMAYLQFGRNFLRISIRKSLDPW